MPEGSSKEELEGCVFDNVGVDLARHTTNLHGEILSAAYRPVGSAVSSFHLDAVSCVEAGADFLGEVLTDDDDL
jgi:hypothetical protein